MVRNNLLFGSERQILQTSVSLLEIDVAETAVEEDLAGVQLELQAQLFVVDVVVSAQVQKCVVEVGEGLLKVAHEKVGHALLEVCDSEVLVQTHSALVAFDLRGPVSTCLCCAHGWRQRTAFSCSPSVAWITPQLNRILDVSEICSKTLRATSNSLLS